jgi:YfiR/HmsC-like
VKILNAIRKMRVSTRRCDKRYLAVAGLILTLGTCPGDEATEKPRDEYQVKAVFLTNFARFVEWPTQTFHRPDEPIVICVAGVDPFGHLLEATVASHTIEGRALSIRHVSSVKKSVGCHILFLSAAERRRSGERLEPLDTTGILEVGESDSGGAGGGAIDFTLTGTRVRFEIDLELAAREKIVISSRLLSLAETVRNRK